MKQAVPLAAALIAGFFTCAQAQDFQPSNDPEIIARITAGAKNLTMVPFSDVVQATTSHRVVPVDPITHRITLETLVKTMQSVMIEINHPEHPIHSAGRINEASRFIEDALMQSLNRVPGWKCEIPQTTDGATQRSGYPDLLLQTPDGAIYIDPKLLSKDSATSSLRTFYYEPHQETSKIQFDAVHLVIGIMHDGWKDGKIRFDGWSIIDLARMPVRLKAEFQASNRELYDPSRTVAHSPSQSSTDKK